MMCLADSIVSFDWFLKAGIIEVVASTIDCFTSVLLSCFFLLFISMNLNYISYDNYTVTCLKLKTFLDLLECEELI